MALVEYSGSSDEEDDHVSPAVKRRKTQAPSSSDGTALPPLPPNFHDLYSSTVRSSVQDDPSLHGGRRRVKPHVEGNWPTHVYLEWLPTPLEARTLSSLIKDLSTKDDSIKSLLHNDLGVELPLHVSLSRPLQLKTDRKDQFLDRLNHAINSSRVHTFTTVPKSLNWHPNETKTRWFLVLALESTDQDELGTLLSSCNAIAKQFDQPLLYEEDGSKDSKFHISIAWSLSNPMKSDINALQPDIQDLKISFDEIKIRIGQDVHTIPLAARRKTPR